MFSQDENLGKLEQESCDLQKIVRKQNAEIIRLTSWIKDQSRITNICTKNVLGVICDGCECGKADQ